MLIERGRGRGSVTHLAQHGGGHGIGAPVARGLGGVHRGRRIYHARRHNTGRHAAGIVIGGNTGEVHSRLVPGLVLVFPAPHRLLGHLTT